MCLSLPLTGVTWEKSPEVRILGCLVPILALLNTQVVHTQLCMKIWGPHSISERWRTELHQSTGLSQLVGVCRVKCLSPEGRMKQRFPLNSWFLGKVHLRFSLRGLAVFISLSFACVIIIVVIIVVIMLHLTILTFNRSKFVNIWKGYPLPIISSTPVAKLPIWVPSFRKTSLFLKNQDSEQRLTRYKSTPFTFFPQRNSKPHQQEVGKYAQRKLWQGGMAQEGQGAGTWTTWAQNSCQVTQSCVNCRPFFLSVHRHGSFDFS